VTENLNYCHVELYKQGSSFYGCLTIFLPEVFHGNRRPLQQGPFVLPKTIRNRHQWSAGTEFIVIDRGDAVVLKPVKPFKETSFESPDASSVYAGSPLSFDDMDQAVAIEAGRHN
jgi:bifunctional DNA-binding transcriptional regulator/antitoxin component of YhaV-PrlF toxin-antitoxin module